MKREHYTLSFNNLPAGGMVGGSFVLYANRDEIKKIRAAAKKYNVRIESLEEKRVYLWTDAVAKFEECGHEGEPVPVGPCDRG